MSFVLSRPLGRALALAVSALLIASGSVSAATVVDRDEFSTTVDAGGGKLRTTLSSEPLNYQSESGAWKPIDLELEAQPDGTVRPQSVDGDLAIPESLGSPVELEHDGRSASLRLLGASGDVDVTGAEAAYEAAMPGVDVSYVARPYGVKESLTLASPLAPRSFAYELRASELWSASMDRGDVVLRDSAGTERYRISAPLAWDSAEDPAFTNALALSVSKVADGRWRVTLRPDAAWLADTARIYPVTIDPDFSWSNGTTHFNGAQDCYLSGYTQANNTFCAQTYLQTGWYNRPYRSIFKFDIAAAIPSNATVSSAVFKAYAPPATPHIAMGHSLHTITSDWDSTATWNNRKAGTPWTTSGGGGDISTNPAYTSSSTTVQAYPAWYSWNAPLAAVQGWVDGSLPNYGFMLRSNNTGNIGNAYAWASTEASTSSQFPADSTKWPSLDVTWTQPAPNPTISVSGSFVDSASAPIDPAEELSADFAAAAPLDSVVRVSVWIDGDDLLLDAVDNSTCSQACDSLSGSLDMSLESVDPGTHTATFVAEDSEGRRGTQSITFQRKSEPSFASLVSEWSDDYAAALGGSSAGLPSSPMPSPVDAVLGQGQCEPKANSKECRAAAASWAASIQTWLASVPNPAGIPMLPEFPYPQAYDPELSKAAATVDGMLRLAEAVARNPAADQPVGISFADPVNEVQASQWAATNALPGLGAVSGSDGPGGWKSMLEPAEVQPLSDTIEAFYQRAEASTTRSVQAIQDEMTETAESWEDAWSPQVLQDNLADAQSYLALLQGRGAVIGGLATTMPAARAATALTDTAAGGAEVTIVAPRSMADIATIEAPAPRPTPISVQSFGLSGSNAGDNCRTRGDANKVPANATFSINPRYWAPARFKADSVLAGVGAIPGDKEHRIRARWTVGHSLAWMCSGRPDRRNVELEARVSVGFPRWSDGWSYLAGLEEGRQTRWANTNLPGRLHLDDLADGGPDDSVPAHDESYLGGHWPYDKNRYPDFALVTEDSRAVQYQTLYQINFQTDDGDTGADDSFNTGGEVTYSAQATSWADPSVSKKVGPLNFSESVYCATKAFQHASCMFSRSTVCYDKAFISESPVYQRISWANVVGTADRQGPYPFDWDAPSQQFTNPCIPKPDPDNPNGGGSNCPNIPNPAECQVIIECTCVNVG